MAARFDNVGSNMAGLTSFSYTHTIAATANCWVGFLFGTGLASGSVTVGGVAGIANGNALTGTTRCLGFYLMKPPTGAVNIAWTESGASAVGAASVSYIGVHNVGAAVTAAAVSPSALVPTIANGGIVVAGFQESSTGAVTLDGTQRFSGTLSSNAQLVRIEDKPSNGTTKMNPTTAAAAAMVAIPLNVVPFPVLSQSVKRASVF